MTECPDNLWLHFFPGLMERWQEECRLVEERYSLFRAFAQAPFFGFRGIVARSGAQYNVTVAAEMDVYPKRRPWSFLTPAILGARENGKLCVDLAWSLESSRFTDVIEAVAAHVEAVHGASSSGERA